MDDAIDVSPKSSILSPVTLIDQRKNKQKLRGKSKNNTKTDNLNRLMSSLSVNKMGPMNLLLLFMSYDKQVQKPIMISQ